MSFYYVNCNHGTPRKWSVWERFPYQLMGKLMAVIDEEDGGEVAARAIAKLLMDEFNREFKGA